MDKFTIIGGTMKYDIEVVEQLTDHLDRAGTTTATITNSTWYPTDNTSITWPYTYSYSWPNTIYLYQILCPKPRCKTYNWLELNKEKNCVKCGSTLKAVSKKADYEVEVG